MQLKWRDHLRQTPCHSFAYPSNGTHLGHLRHNWTITKRAISHNSRGKTCEYPAILSSSIIIPSFPSFYYSLTEVEFVQTRSLLALIIYSVEVSSIWYSVWPLIATLLRKNIVKTFGINRSLNLLWLKFIASDLEFLIASYQVLYSRRNIAQCLQITNCCRFLYWTYWAAKLDKGATLAYRSP